MTHQRPPPPPPPRTFAVWPWFVSGGLAATLGAVLVILWWPPDYPSKSDLVKVSGNIDKVAIRDDLSDTTAGAAMPGLTSIFFKLENTEGEFRYSHTRPQYLKVRDTTSVAIDVWVDPNQLDTEQVIDIWQIKERNPYDKPGDETFVSYEDIVERLTRSSSSMVSVGTWLLAGAGVLFLAGYSVMRFNRRRLARTSM